MIIEQVNHRGKKLVIYQADAAILRECRPYIFNNFNGEVMHYFWQDLRSWPLIAFTMATAVITGSFIRECLSFDFIPVFVVLAIGHRYIGGHMAMKGFLELEADYTNKNYWIDNERERSLLVMYDETNGINDRKLVSILGVTKFSEIWFKKEDHEQGDEEGKRTSPEEIGEYKRFMVMETYQRCGIGTLMINAAEIFAKSRFGYRRIYLNTSSDLESGLNFYRKNGFQVIERPKLKLFNAKYRLFDFGYSYFYCVAVKKVF
ncbi:hypothetical protein Ciccas_008121 [Cichlidogyrus casuarinus]|uniref:N-acetyltransferase domain-containing protein n=1 Tax=Cichlidogyrus casuarinus TaxID=1844966 RepID=A0ABD2Q1M9_9PLAT